GRRFVRDDAIPRADVTIEHLKFCRAFRGIVSRQRSRRRDQGEDSEGERQMSHNRVPFVEGVLPHNRYSTRRSAAKHYRTFTVEYGSVNVNSSYCVTSCDGSPVNSPCSTASESVLCRGSHSLNPICRSHRPQRPAEASHVCDWARPPDS